ncbi:hypothetical protein [Paenibacillus swuensis]|nr:hypothetical protein [Paenibacillus swuensis]
MPLYNFSEIWTPLKIAGIRFYRDEEARIWIKLWSKSRRLLRR